MVPVSAVYSIKLSSFVLFAKPDANDDFLQAPPSGSDKNDRKVFFILSCECHHHNKCNMGAGKNYFFISTVSLNIQKRSIRKTKNTKKRKKTRRIKNTRNTTMRTISERIGCIIRAVVVP